MNRRVHAGGRSGRVSVSGRGWRAVLAVAGVLAVVATTAPPAPALAAGASQWHLNFLKVSQAHRISTGVGVTVAVIDTGVDAKHPDLAGAVLKGKDVAILPASPPDGRTDIDGHGTAMAGLIAGRGRGPDRLSGIAPGAKILPVRDANTGDGLTSYTDKAIEWAAGQGAGVISMSFGSKEDDFSMADAIEAARRADVVLVAGVGNKPKSRAVEYPAASPGVIAVGGVDRRGSHAAISVTGPQVDIAAPAVDLTSTGLEGQPRTATGTSGSTALVAGAAALVRAKYPDLSADEVAYRLTATATDKGPKGRDSEYGYGVLNVVGALTADLPPMPAGYADPMPSHPVGPPAAAPRPASPAEPRSSTGLLLLGTAGLLLVGGVGALVWWIGRRR